MGNVLPFNSLIMNNLPKYWAVECPIDYSTNKKWQKVISYLNSIDSGWQGIYPNTYYGVDKRENNKGTFGSSSYISNYVKVLSINEFIKALKNKDEFVLPKKWCIRSKSKSEDNIINNYARNAGAYWWTDINNYASIYYMCICNNKYETSISYIEHDGFIPYKEITFEQFKKYVLKEDIMIMNNGEITQTITKLQLKEIWKIACDNWKLKLEEYAKQDVFSDVITFTNEQVEEMFKASTTAQTIVLEKFLNRAIEDRNAFKEAVSLTNAAKVKELSNILFKDQDIFQIIGPATPSERPELKYKAFYISSRCEVITGEARDGGTYIEILKK